MSLYNYEESFIEIQFPLVEEQGEKVPADNFLKVKETLTRIGAPAYSKDPNVHQKTLWQSCHILYKRQKYYLVHFKEMFLLDGKASRTKMTTEDLARRNAIAILLQQWGLIEIVHPQRAQIPPAASIDTIKIIPFKDKQNWNLCAKYEIGKTRK